MPNVTQFGIAAYLALFLPLGTVLAEEMQPAEAADSSATQLYSPLSADEARAATLKWVAAHGAVEKVALEDISALWAGLAGEATTEEVFDTVIRSFSLADPEAGRMIEACVLRDFPLQPPASEARSTFETSSDEFFLANVRYFYARYLAQRRMYDEALDVFEAVDVSRVVDPAGCLFYRAVCEHSLLMKKPGLETITRLLKNTEDVPVRYSTVAALMQYDLESLREKTLMEVSKKMSDVERRLDLGRGGPKVQKVESEVVAALDEIIEKLEQQQGGGGGGSGSQDGPSRSNQSSSPAADSSIKGSTAPGEVDKKNLGRESGWGSLPPKEQAKAKNHIDRNFPAHYRRAVEEYFKKISREPASPRR